MSIDDLIKRTIESDDCEPLLREVEKMQTAFLVRFDQTNMPDCTKVLANVVGNALCTAAELLRSGRSPDWTDNTLICEIAEMLGVKEFPQFVG